LDISPAVFAIVQAVVTVAIGSINQIIHRTDNPGLPPPD
jgi:hypothetical protein